MYEEHRLAATVERSPGSLMFPNSLGPRIVREQKEQAKALRGAEGFCLNILVVMQAKLLRFGGP